MPLRGYSGLPRLLDILGWMPLSTRRAAAADGSDEDSYAGTQDEQIEDHLESDQRPRVLTGRRDIAESH